MDVYGFAFIEESYERQGYRNGDTQAGVCVQGAGKTSGKKSGEKEITNPKVGVFRKGGGADQQNFLTEG